MFIFALTDINILLYTPPRWRKENMSEEVLSEIRRRRKALRITQNQLCDEVNRVDFKEPICQPYLSALESKARKYRNVSHRTVTKLQRALDRLEASRGVVSSLESQRPKPKPKPRRKAA